MIMLQQLKRWLAKSKISDLPIKIKKSFIDDSRQLYRNKPFALFSLTVKIDPALGCFKFNSKALFTNDQKTQSDMILITHTDKLMHQSLETFTAGFDLFEGEWKPFENEEIELRARKFMDALSRYQRKGNEVMVLVESATKMKSKADLFSHFIYDPNQKLTVMIYTPDTDDQDVWNAAEMFPLK